MGYSEVTEIIGDENPLSVNQVVLRNNKTNISSQLNTGYVYGYWS